MFAKTIAFLYPGHASEQDYPLIASRIDPPIRIHVVHTAVPVDAHRTDALKMMGDVSLLVGSAEELGRLNVDAVVWACTSGSFVFGLEGAKAQVAELEQKFGVPVSSTALAFVNAMRDLNVGVVRLSATYPEDVARLFGGFIEDAGFEVADIRWLDILTGVEVGTVSKRDVIEFVAEGNPDVDAVLVPDTALATVGFLEELEAAAETIVLTANQVTMWEGLRLVGWQGIYGGGGALFSDRASRA